MPSASMTREQVKASPEAGTRKPVPLQHAVAQFSYYGYPFYRGEGQLLGGGPRLGMNATGPLPGRAHHSPQGESIPADLADYASLQLSAYRRAKASFVDAQAKLRRDRGDNPHLRSGRAIAQYPIHVPGGDVGHVEALLLDDEAWAVRYLATPAMGGWVIRCWSRRHGLPTSAGAMPTCRSI